MWGRALAGFGFTAGFVVWLITAVSVGGASFALNTTHGLWLNMLFECLLVTFAIAASAPHGPTRRPPHEPPPAAFQPRVTTTP